MNDNITTQKDIQEKNLEDTDQTPTEEEKEKSISKDDSDIR